MYGNNSEEVYAVPGEVGIIDVINPETGLTGVYGETEEQIRARYPLAVRMTWEAWRTDASAKQVTPIEWMPTTESKYVEMLEVLPPIEWSRGAFLVGEPTDHCVATGRARYQAYRQIGPKGDFGYYASSRPITVAELRAELDGTK